MAEKAPASDAGGSAPGSMSSALSRAPRSAAWARSVPSKAGVPSIPLTLPSKSAVPRSPPALASSDSGKARSSPMVPVASWNAIARPCRVALPSARKGPSSERAESTASIRSIRSGGRPSPWRYTIVPFLTVAESILVGSRSAASGPPAAGCAGVSPAAVSMSQPARPSAKRSSSITGSTSARLVTAISPPSSGPSASARSSDLIRAMSGTAAPGALAMRRSASVISGEGRMETAIAPSMASGRPTMASRRSAISGLNRSQSRKGGTRKRAAATRARRTRIA